MSLMSLWLQHGSKLSNTPWRWLWQPWLLILPRMEVLSSAHNRRGQLILSGKYELDEKGVLTGAIQFNSSQLTRYFKHTPLKRISFLHPLFFPPCKILKRTTKMGTLSINSHKNLRFNTSHLSFFRGRWRKLQWFIVMY